MEEVSSMCYNLYMSNITIIGSGVMGSAMSFPCKTNGHTVRLVGTMLDRDIISHAKTTGYHLTLKRVLPAAVEYYQLEELEEALVDADLVISGVSSFGVEWFAEEIIPLLPANVPVLSVTKGLQSVKTFDATDDALNSYPLYYSQKFPGRDFCAVGGPCTAYELADLDNTHVCFCGNNMNSLLEIKELLKTHYYHISLINDTEGLEFAVAIKNAYALVVTLAVGFSLKDGDTLHYNSQAALFGQSIKEMRALLSLFGHNDDNIVYGAGDLYVTVFGGRTRKLGTLLGQGFSFDAAMEQLSDTTLESVVITKRIGSAVLAKIETGKADKKTFPLLLHIHNIVCNGIEVCIPWDSFG